MGAAKPDQRRQSGRSELTFANRFVEAPIAVAVKALEAIASACPARCSYSMLRSSCTPGWYSTNSVPLSLTIMCGHLCFDEAVQLAYDAENGQ